MRALLLAALIALPSVAFAANTTFFGPIVPQCPENGMCRACDLVTAADNLLKFLIALSVFAAAIMFAYAGFLYITAAASPKNIDSAKNIFWKVFLGLIIVLIAWIGIDLILRVFTGSSLSFYSNIRCVSFNSQSGGWDVPGLRDTSGTGVEGGGGQPPEGAGGQGLENVDSNTNYSPYWCSDLSQQQNGTADQRMEGCQLAADGSTIITASDYQYCHRSGARPTDRTPTSNMPCSSVTYVTVAAPQGSGVWRQCFTWPELAGRYGLNSNTKFCANDHYGPGRGYTDRGSYSVDVARCWSNGAACTIPQTYGNECRPDRNGVYPCVIKTKPTPIPGG